MKVFIVLACCLSALARASLEPAGYRTPGGHHQSNYLPPSHNVPGNRYIPSAVESNRHPSSATFNNQVSNSYSLPSKNSPVPFTQYLPANRHQSHHEIGATHGSNFGENLTPSNEYIPANENKHSYPNSPPASDYLPPRQNKNRVSRPSNVYLTPDVRSGHSADGYSGPSGFASAGHYSGAASVNRHNKIDQVNRGHYSFGHSGQNTHSAASGYQYNAPENQVPAKYDFEYQVKDNYGNDYGHKESRNGENTRGMYTVLLPDGRRQIVHYEADSHGYRPTITYEETGSQSGYNNQGYQY